MISRKSLTWKDNDLFHKDTLLARLEKDGEQKRMYWIEFPDGTFSADYYNKTRAKDNAVRITLDLLNQDSQETDREAH